MKGGSEGQQARAKVRVKVCGGSGQVVREVEGKIKVVMFSLYSRESQRRKK